MNKSTFLVLALVAAAFASSKFAIAEPMRIMTFNTMCDFCGKKEQTGNFRDRLDAIADTINRYSPDLISLQEVRTARQVRKIIDGLNRKYHTVFDRGVLKYTDSTLLIRKDRFRVVSTGGAWLGPRAPRFSMGWEAGLPRRIQWATVENLITGEKFRFVGTHFDNDSANKEPSAELAVEWFGRGDIPTIFAGDTNLKTPSPGYGTLLKSFRDTYDEVTEHPYYSSRPTVNSDGCNLSPTNPFPDCRIDHVLLSRGSPWKVKAWGLDVEKYFGSLGFVSDHRAVIVDLE